MNFITHLKKFKTDKANYKSTYGYIFKLLLVALSYFAFARLGLAIPYIGSHITLIWLPTGIAVAVLARGGFSYWPGIYFGALLTNFSIDGLLQMDACIAISNTLGPVLTAHLLKRLKFHNTLDRAYDILLLVATAAAGMLVSASGGVLNLIIFNMLDVSDATSSWLAWWAGDIVGVLLALPILLNISKDIFRILNTQRFEFLACTAILFALSYVVFYLNININDHPVPLVFLLLPVIVWSAMRFKITGASICLMIPVLIAVISTSRGLGPLYIEGFRHGLFLLWMFITTLVILNLMVIALQTARNASDAKVSRMIKLYAALNQFNHSILSCEKEQELFAQVCRDAVQFGGLKMAWIGLINNQNTLIKPVSSFGDGTEYLENLNISIDPNDPLGNGPTGISIRENSPVWCQDFQHDPSTAPWHARGKIAGWGASVSLPLRRNGSTIGALALYDAEPNAFDEAAKNLLLEMATTISNALSRLSLLAERADAEEAMRIAAVTFETQEGIMITNSNGDILRVNQAFQDITGYTEHEVLGKNPRILQSGRHDSAFYKAMWANITNTGRWQGEVWDKRKNNEIYPKNLTITSVKDENHRVTNYVAVFHDITKLKQSEQDIHKLAFYDALTQLPNRRLLMDRLQQGMASSMRTKRYGALLFLDLDQFKVINDTQGHGTGDQLLIEAARRLESCVRVDDTVARLGGDEFVAVLSGLSDDADEAASQTELIAEKIRQELGQPYLLDKFECNSTVSIGASLFFGQQENEEILLQHADVAMYQAKSAGRNTIRFFDPKMQTVLDLRAGMEADLRQAIDKKQFRLYYQIQVDSLLHPLGAEVLIRWEHHEQGLISPIQFIPLAEETGLIVTIGLWVLQTACAQLKKWHHDPLTSNMTLAVNVSAKQFRQPDFVSQVQHILQETGAKPSRLKLELTESTVLENVEDTILKMRELKALGVSFSMDDFGTGYSSLQYLKRLPINQIKIDQSFVRDIATDPNDAAIVQTIIAMTEALGLDVIAEGVETEPQQAFLKLRGCHAFQGYLFGKPVPIEEFEEKLIKL